MRKYIIRSFQIEWQNDAGKTKIRLVLDCETKDDAEIILCENETVMNIISIKEINLFSIVRK